MPKHIIPELPARIEEPIYAGQSIPKNEILWNGSNFVTTSNSDKRAKSKHGMPMKATEPSPSYELNKESPVEHKLDKKPDVIHTGYDIPKSNPVKVAERTANLSKGLGHELGVRAHRLDEGTVKDYVESEHLALIREMKDDRIELKAEQKEAKGKAW